MKILSYLSGTEKKIFFVLLAVAVFSLMYALVLEPLAKEYKNLNQELLAKSLKLHKDIRLSSQKNSVISQYKLLADKIKLVSSDDQEAASMLTTIEDMARSGSINILDMKPLIPKDTSLYKEFSVELKVEANIQSLMRFIYDLVSSEKVLRVERLSLNKKDSSTDLLVSTITVSRIAVKPLDI